MTPRSSGSAPRLNRHQERSLSLQLVPRSIPIRPQPPPAHSSHYRSPSPSRFPRFEETSVSEKSRCDGVLQTSPAKAEASTSRTDAPESLSSHHPSRPSSESSRLPTIPDPGYHACSLCSAITLVTFRIPSSSSKNQAMVYRQAMVACTCVYIDVPRICDCNCVLENASLSRCALLSHIPARSMCYLRPSHSFRINCEYRPLTFICLRPQL
jgi:hypothetical protein